MVAVCVRERDTDRCMYKNCERDIVYICECEREKERSSYRDRENQNTERD